MYQFPTMMKNICNLHIIMRTVHNEWRNWLKAEMESSRPWPWPRGQLVMSLALENMYLVLIIFTLCA